jgi:EAL domain-containing protein (putative c-di-GMP-specific phosphodiesterase class I)
MQASVRVCDVIGCGVIAEFVEDTEIVQRLRTLGVGYAQGFGIARPAPLE